MSHVQTQVDDFGFQNNVLTTGINTTSGNAMVVGCGSATTLTGVTDTYGNMWTPHPASPVSYNGVYLAYVWYCLNIVGGAGHVITFAGGGAQKGTAVSEFSGRSKTAIDTRGGAATAASNTQTGPTLTGVAGLADIWAFDTLSYAGSAVTWTAGSGFTIPTNGYVSGSTNIPTCVEYKNAVSAGNYTPSFTNNSTGQGGFLALSLPVPAVAPLQVSSLSSMNPGPC